jgi:predicted HicB family RNase H-like nuclease
MNVMNIDGYRARIDDDPDLDRFRGEILGLNGGAGFCGRNPKQLGAEFRKSLKVFLVTSTSRGPTRARGASRRIAVR